jgi:hypothetical protein
LQYNYQILQYLHNGKNVARKFGNCVPVMGRVGAY